MLKIEIDSKEVTDRPRRGDRRGTYRAQRAYWHKQGEKYPKGIWIPLGEAQPYEPGLYTLAVESFRDFAEMLEFFPRLQKAQASRAAA